MPRKLGDFPTMKVEPDRFAAFARRADSHARGSDASSAPDIQVSLEYLEDVPTAVRRSAMLPVARTLEDADLGAIPVIAVTKEDLAWFEFEPDTYGILALVDGHATVADILRSIAVDPERAMNLLRDLELQRVIAFG
ncbi:MAG: hypothetical protein ABSE49_22535 [Polyangiaceae bacterium]